MFRASATVSDLDVHIDFDLKPGFKVLLVGGICFPVMSFNRLKLVLSHSSEKCLGHRKLKGVLWNTPTS